MTPRIGRNVRVLLTILVGQTLVLALATARAAEEPAHSPRLDEMIVNAAKLNGIPERLIRRVVMRESKYNAAARNHAYWGLMQISYPTAKSMGFKGSPNELLDPLVNLTYAVPYLANAFIIAGKNEDAAIRLYASGYYFTARERGLLGVLRTAGSPPGVETPSDQSTVAAAAPNYGIFGGLFGTPQQPPATREVAYNTPPPGSAPPASSAPPAPQAAPASVSQGPSPAAEADASSADGDVAMVADKHGQLKPPAKWTHDGGTTVMARGEQAIEKVAAYEKASPSDDRPRRAARRPSRKTTEFASLDMPPAAAQAYAAVGGGQGPGLQDSASQAAIAQATAGNPAASPLQQPIGSPDQVTDDRQSEQATPTSGHRHKHFGQGHRPAHVEMAATSTDQKSAPAH